MKMSDPKTSVPSSHFDLYTKFYAQALRLATSSSSNLDNDAKITSDEVVANAKSRNQKIIITLDTITKLIFGLDEKNKTNVVLYGGGALELVIALVKSSCFDDLDKELATEFKNKIQTSAMKAVKTCSIRNPAGRSRARAAGVVSFLKEVLDRAVLESDSNDVIAEEGFTTLAAICLGDDLNALQSSIMFKPLLSKSKTVFPDAKSMHQKTLYLETLFAAVEKEQEKLIQSITKANGCEKTGLHIFFENIDECEKEIRIGFGHIEDEKYAMSNKHYKHALSLLSPYLSHTSLLDELMVEIRSKKAQAAMEIGKFDECLEDTSLLLERKDTAEENLRINLLKLHAKALTMLGREEEGKEVLAKLKLLSPQSEQEISQQLKDNVKIDAK